MPVLPHGIGAGNEHQSEEYTASVCQDVIPFEPAAEYPGLQHFERATKTDHRRTADDPLRNRLSRTARYERRDGEYYSMAWDMERSLGMELSLP
jgi:hypothetical protein